MAVAAALASLAWLTAVLAAPLLAGASDVVAGVLYAVGSLICHQRPERSFHLAGAQLPVCARCLGLYAGGAAGLVAWCLHSRRRVAAWPRQRAVSILIAAGIPTAASVASAWLQSGDPSNAWRAALALPLGAAAGLIAGAALTDHLK